MNATLRITLAISFLGLAGCQAGKDPEARTVSTVSANPRPSALLLDVSNLKPSPLHAGTWYELSSSLKNFDGLIIDEPVMATDAFGSEGAEDGVTAQLTARFKEELKGALGQSYEIRSSPDRKTARLQVLLKRIDRSRERGTGARIIGGAAADLRIIDSITGATLMAASEDDRAADTHAMTSLDPYHDAKATFVHWSARTARALRAIDELATRP